jgi:hypothetical protein
MTTSNTTHAKSTNNGITTGPNRTGIGIVPQRAQELIDAAEGTHPSAPGNEHGVTELRESYSDESEPIGSVPPPAMDDAEGDIELAREQVSEARQFAVFSDKLGERLAFERTGVRLYEALLSKARVAPPLERGPSVEELEAFHAQELAHFDMLRGVAEELGADPTVVTPSADVMAILSMGIPHVLSDPRTSLRQCLDAVLLAELADHDGWTLLIEIAQALGYDDLVERFEAALDEERVHLTRVRTWVTESALAIR